MTAIALLMACSTSEVPAPPENPNIATATKWVTAVATGKTEALAAVQELMAQDGQLYRRRYVGFGFTWDPNDEQGRMITGDLGQASPDDFARLALEDLQDTDMDTAELVAV
jgi:hypothetical protein